MINFKHSLRTLWKTPFVTAVAVLSLGLGIGANTAIFSLFDQLLLQPLPVEDPSRLVNLADPGPKPGYTSCGQAGDCDEIFSYPMFRDLQNEQSSLEGLAAHQEFGANLAFRNRTRSGSGEMVSGSYFPVLHLRPALGRLLGPDDDRGIGQHAVTVLSYGYWQRELGADPGVLGEPLVVNGHPMTVVGVAPKGFRGTTLGNRPDVFVPLTMRGVVRSGHPGFDNRRSYWAYLFGRLKPGVTLQQARANLGTIYTAILNDVEALLQEGVSGPDHGSISGQAIGRDGRLTRSEHPARRSAEAPHPPFRGSGRGLADRVRQHREPSSGPGSEPGPGDGRPGSAGGRESSTSGPASHGVRRHGPVRLRRQRRDRRVDSPYRRLDSAARRRKRGQPSDRPRDGSLRHRPGGGYRPRLRTLPRTPRHPEGPRVRTQEQRRPAVRASRVDPMRALRYE